MEGLVGGNPARCRRSPGERILALIINLLTDREPLYQVWEAFALTDVPLLLGAGIMAADLTDAAWGRALDKLAAAGAAAVFRAGGRTGLCHRRDGPQRDAL
jgi:hypothetical protein